MWKIGLLVAVLHQRWRGQPARLVVLHLSCSTASVGIAFYIDSSFSVLGTRSSADRMSR
jgi:hypothetical protein